METPATLTVDEIVALLLETAPVKVAVSDEPGATPPNQLEAVDQVVLVAPTQVKAELEEKAQLRLLPPSVTVLSEYSLMRVPEVLLESVTVALSIAGVPEALMFHRVPGVEETKRILSLESSPSTVQPLVTVVVVEAGNVQVELVESLVVSVFVRL